MLNILCCYLCYVISIFICIITNIQVLFHLLDRVRESSTTADKEKIESGGGNILIHHSRDTAEKQWAETWVLTLAGVARIFNTRRYLLQPLGRCAFFFFFLLSIQVINVKGNLEKYRFFTYYIHFYFLRIIHFNCQSLLLCVV